MEKVEKGIGVLDKALNLVERYKLKTIFKGCFIILLIAALIGFLNNPTWIFEKYEEWKDKQHQTEMDMRSANNDKIQHIIERELYKLDAKRIMVLELHNGNTGMGGLPFNKCTATFEYMDDDVYPIAQQYQEQQLSLIPFSSILFKNGYWCGDVEELENVDRALYHKMASNGTKHFAASVIRGVDKPIALLFISFTDIDENHNCEYIQEEIHKMSLDIALLLELNKR